MDFNEYQAFTRTTAKYQDACHSESAKIVYCLFGLAGEMGESFEKLKKVLRVDGFDGIEMALFPSLKTAESERFRELMKKEMGDILWYLARLADEMGMSFQDVAATNVAKLSDRKVRGVLHAEGDER
jgi:NTP pyrophosphatase (non-canonical NTP hydrolase)